MTNDIGPYGEVRESGNRWIGRIPPHWELMPLGAIGRFSRGSGGTKEDDVPEGVPCIRYGDLYSKYGQFITAPASYVSRERASDYTAIGHGDLLFAGSGETIEEIGKSAVSLLDGEAVCGGDVVIFRPAQPIDARFLGYAADCVASIHQKACMGRGITVMHIYPDELKRLQLALPPLPEQKSIVRFLDHAGRRIQRAIRDKQKLIALLNEQKQAVIHRAVTRGLDPNARTKPSGVDWLGDVPEHWKVQRLGSVLCERGEINVDGSVQDVLSLLRRRGVIPYDEKGNVGNKKSEDITRYKIVRPNDIVMNSMNVIIGSVGLSTFTGCLSPVYYVLKRRSSLDDPRYLNMIFQLTSFQRSLVRIGYGILAHRMRIPMQLLKSELIPRPPEAEQLQIIDAIGEMTGSSDRLVAKTEREIFLLREFRTRLIADAVTGQMDVRDASLLLPDAVDESEPVYEIDVEPTGEPELEDLEAVDV